MPSANEHFRLCPTCGSEYAAEARFCARDGVRLPAPQSRPVDQDPYVGQLISERFRVVRAVGGGGFGTVYEALHLDHRRRVAVKLLHKLRIRDPESRARMLREAHILSALAHAHIVKLYDYGAIHDGTPFLIMEYLDGTSLAEVLQQVQRLPPGRAVDVAYQIATALAYLHARGVFHRDLKADNVMLQLRDSQPDFVTLVDFGIAKVVDAPGLTTDGQQPGTLANMPPESFAGMGPTSAFDCYALGVLLFELLVGAPAFRNQGLAVVLEKEQAPPRPSERSEHLAIPTALDNLVVQLLQPDPGARPTANEVIVALEQIRILLPRRALGSMHLARTYLFAGHGLTGAATVLLPLAAQVDELSAAREDDCQRLLDLLTELLPLLPETDRVVLDAQRLWPRVETLLRQEEQEGIELALLEDRLNELRAEETRAREQLRQESLALSARLRELAPSTPGRTALLVRRRDVELCEDTYCLPQVATLEAEAQVRRQLIDVMRDQRDEALSGLARVVAKVTCPSALRSQQAAVGALRARLEASATALAAILARSVGPRGRSK